MESLNFGLIGTGKIGNAVFSGYCSENGRKPKHVYISNRSQSKADALKQKYPSMVTIEADNQKIIDQSDVVFIGLLPNIAKEVE